MIERDAFDGGEGRKKGSVSKLLPHRRRHLQALLMAGT